MKLLAYRLIESGYFPKELPPSLSTATFAEAIRASTIRPEHLLSAPKSASICLHRLSKQGHPIRTLELGVINPVAFYRLALFVAARFRRLQKATSRGRLSKSFPLTRLRAPRAVEPHKSLEDMEAEHTMIRRGSGYLLVADIHKFYGSIKPTLLARTFSPRKDPRLANCVRTLVDLVLSCQAGSPNGIPIGPDTSLLVAELLMAAIDHRLTHTAGFLQGFRYFDDFEFLLATQPQAKAFANSLRAALLNASLRLNPAKTHILPVPRHDGLDWIREPRRYRLDGPPTLQQRNAKSFFAKIRALIADHPAHPVCKYALGELPSKIAGFGPKALRQVHDDLLDLGLPQRQTVAPFTQLLVLLKSRGIGLRADRIAEILASHINACATCFEANEVSWALWGFLKLSMPLPKRVISSLEPIRDSLVHLQLLDIANRALVRFRPSESAWLKTFRRPQALYGPHWLLAYEAGRRGWLPHFSVGTIRSDPFFNRLFTNGITFYNEPKRL